MTWATVTGMGRRLLGLKPGAVQLADADLPTVEPHEEKFDGRWQDKTALKGIVKVEPEPHYGAVKLEGTVKMKHEFEWMEEESSKFKEQLGNHVKEEVQDGQDSNPFDQKKIGDDYWEEDENNSAPEGVSVMRHDAAQKRRHWRHRRQRHDVQPWSGGI
ncbi:hypothetical protein GPALN_004202 [Globodera pallida]|nr:hypothetical protein GPALN_004202 [Globodera pallida]